MTKFYINADQEDSTDDELVREQQKWMQCLEPGSELFEKRKKLAKHGFVFLSFSDLTIFHRCSVLDT